jgi:excisionase family DNA binding protein
MATLITIPDVMARLNVRRKTVLRLVTTGKLKAFKVGRQWRFDPRHVDQFLQASTFTPRRMPEQVVTPRRSRSHRSADLSAGAQRYC